MAFLRIEKKESGTYLRILESYRDEAGNSRHRILYTLGKAEDYTAEQLRRIGIRFFELGGGQVKSLLKGEILEIGRYNYGFQYVYRQAFEYYGIHHVLRRLEKSSRIKFNLCDAVMLMLVSRLDQPSSKKSNFELQNEYLNLPKVELHHIYRALDKLSQHNELIQRQIYQAGRTLFNSQLDVVFYDVTTFYFDSEIENEGSLRQIGFSKDGKIGRTQILFSMMIDSDKNPIGYRIFEGNTFEGHTFEKALNDLKQQYNIGRIIIVADRGMLSKNNIDKTLESGYEYIVGERLKSLPHKIREQLLDKKQYVKEWHYINSKDEDVCIQYTNIEHEGKTIISTYSAKRAEKDRKDREHRIEKAAKLLKNQSTLNQKAARFFLKNEKDQSFVLDEEKIARHAKYDGLLAISTNVKLDTIQVLDQYKQLYKIEQSFRTFKSHLELRPMFHWTNERIKGHICMCYLAYTLQNYVLQKAKKHKIELSETSLRRLLSKMQLSLVQNQDQQFYLRSTPQEKENQLLNALGLKQLSPIIDKNMLKI